MKTIIGAVLIVIGLIGLIWGGIYYTREEKVAIGKSHLVPDMCRASVAAGADGLIIEVHNDPEHALTDGAQSINPTQFGEVMRSIKRVAAAVDRDV